MFDIIQKMMIDENGATANEYGFFAAFAAFAALAGVGSLLAMGSSLETFFTGVGSVKSFAIVHTDGGGLRG